jgi:hypothetical protein
VTRSETELLIAKELETPEGCQRLARAMTEPHKEFCVLEYCRSPGCDGCMKGGRCNKCGWSFPKEY